MEDARKSATIASRMKKSRGKPRAPLADLTNAPILVKRATPTSPLIPGDISTRGPKSERRSGLVGASVVPESPPRADPSKLGSGGDGGNYDDLESLTVYARRTVREIQSKGKEPCSTSGYSSPQRMRSIKYAEPCSTSGCSPLQRMRSINKGKLVDDTYIDKRKAFSVPFQKPKKKPRYVAEAMDKPILPQDFVDKQRAYFAEIDAFELPEEVVSESWVE